jgi:hypothetical protein
LIADAILDYASNSKGTQGEPEEITRDEMKGVEPSDEIRTAGIRRPSTAMSEWNPTANSLRSCDSPPPNRVGG